MDEIAAGSKDGPGKTELGNAAAPSGSKRSSQVGVHIRGSLKRSSLIVGRQRGSLVLQQVQQSTVHETGTAIKSTECISELINRIGFGRAQIETLLILLGYPFSEGSELISMTSIQRAIKDDFQLTELQTGLLVTWSIIGLSLGTLWSGKLADVRGRRFAIISSYLAMCISAALTGLATGFYSMSMLRFASGFACGQGVPAAVTMLGEISPTHLRSTMYAGFAFMFVIGQIYACIGLCIWMPNLKDVHEWRLITDWCSLPTLFFLILSVVRMRESVHWLLIQGRVREARMVLMDMALKNGHPEIARDLSHSHPEEDSDEKESSASTGVLRKLWECPKSSFSLACFVILCYIGNITGFGMDCLWPQILTEEAEHLHDENEAAKELLVLRIAGLPVCLFSLLAVWSDTHHKTVIMLTGFLGAFAVSSLIYFKRKEIDVELETSTTPSRVGEAELIVISAFICMASNLSFASTLEFITESFPTEVRATANGVAIGFGRLASMVAPLILEIGGEENFLILAALSFFPMSCAVLPLKDHHHEDLEDFARSPDDAESTTNVADHDRLGHEADELEDEESDVEDESGVFDKSTLGARLEMLLLVAGLGVLSGSATSFYLFSIGYFEAQDEKIFSLQLAIVSASFLVTLLVAWSSESLGVEAGLFWRVVIGSLVMGMMVFSMAVVESRGALFCVGAVVGGLAALIFACGLDVASAIHPRALPWVYAGVAVGAATPQGVTRLVGYGPGASASVRFLFFGTPAVMCLVGSLFYCRFHGQLEAFSAFSRLPSLRDRRAQSRNISSQGQWPVGSWRLISLGMANLSMMVTCGFFLLSQIPYFGYPVDTQFLYKYRVIGDMIGRILAVMLLGADDAKNIHDDDDREGADEAAGPSVRALPRIRCWSSMALLTLASLSSAAVAILLALPLAFPPANKAVLDRYEAIRVSNDDVMHWGLFFVFCTASFVESCQIVLVSSSMPPDLRRATARSQVVWYFVAIVIACILAQSVHLEKPAPAFLDLTDSSAAVHVDGIFNWQPSPANAGMHAVQRHPLIRAEQSLLRSLVQTSLEQLSAPTVTGIQIMSGGLIYPE